MSSMSISRVPSVFDFYADLADSYPWITVQESEMAAFGATVSEPIGVVGAIVPWNTPLSLASYKIAPALLTGCTVVLKLPPEAPGELLILAEVAAEIGLPAGVLNVVTAEREVSEQLVRDPRVDKVAFTGSSAVGKRIATICGERLARYTLELGGKSAAVILDDYDPATAAAAITGQEITLTGQNCSSLTRVIVPTVFANVDNDSTIAQEEIFGPVISVIPAESEEHAIELANGTDFGLNSSVFTNDIERAYHVARRLRAGTVGHNGFKTDTKIGFGSVKQSGVGREGGVRGVLPYIEPKTVLLNEMPERFR